MTYSQGHPVRLVGGRLALDFVNTADWSADGRIVSEKLQSPDDVAVWAEALGLERAAVPDSMEELHALRSSLRALFVNGAQGWYLAPIKALQDKEGRDPAETARSQPIEALIAASALSLVADQRELSRLKMCPGENCGWLFIDETKNARRKWCSMETCGNRAKAMRHYNRSRAGGT